MRGQGVVVNGTIGLRLLILVVLRPFHPLVKVGLSKVDISSKVGVGSTIRTLKLGIYAVLAFEKGTNAFIMPNMSARSNKQGLTRLCGRLVSRGGYTEGYWEQNIPERSLGRLSTRHCSRRPRAGPWRGSGAADV